MTAVMLAAAALVLFVVVRTVSGWRARQAPVGWMSDRWLAEQRTSRPR